MPATNTYTPIASITLASAVSEVFFTALPSSFKDLVLVANWQNSGNSSAGRLQLNNDTAGNYHGAWIAGNGSTSSSGNEGSATSARIAGAIAGPVNTFANSAILHFTDYSMTDRHKNILSEFNAASAETQLTITRWSSNSAITSIRFFDVLGQTFQTGARFDLYGVIA